MNLRETARHPSSGRSRLLPPLQHCAVVPHITLASFLDTYLVALFHLPPLDDEEEAANFHLPVLESNPPTRAGRSIKLKARV